MTGPSISVVIVIVFALVLFYNGAWPTLMTLLFASRLYWQYCLAFFETPILSIRDMVCTAALGTVVITVMEMIV